jgi:hypothetical protein
MMSNTSAASVTKLPPMKWSQTPDTVSIVFRVVYGKDEQLEPVVAFESDRLQFRVTAAGVDYDLDAETFEAISVDKSAWSILPNGSVLVVMHKANEKEDEYVMWPFPLKDHRQYKSFVQVDWERWEDSDVDESDDGESSRMPAPPPPSLSNEAPDIASMMSSLGGGEGGGGDMQKMMEMMGGGGEGGGGDMQKMMEMMGGGGGGEGGMPDFSKLAENMTDTDMESMMKSMQSMAPGESSSSESGEEGEEGEGDDKDETSTETKESSEFCESTECSTETKESSECCESPECSQEKLSE